MTSTNAIVTAFTLALCAYHALKKAIETNVGLERQWEPGMNTKQTTDLIPTTKTKISTALKFKAGNNKAAHAITIFPQSIAAEPYINMER